MFPNLPVCLLPVNYSVYCGCHLAKSSRCPGSTVTLPIVSVGLLESNFRAWQTDYVCLEFQNLTKFLKWEWVSQPGLNNPNNTQIQTLPSSKQACEECPLVHLCVCIIAKGSWSEWILIQWSWDSQRESLTSKDRGRWPHIPTKGAAILSACELDRKRLWTKNPKGGLSAGFSGYWQGHVLVSTLLHLT